MFARQSQGQFDGAFDKVPARIVPEKWWGVVKVRPASTRRFLLPSLRAMFRRGNSVGWFERICWGDPTVLPCRGRASATTEPRNAPAIQMHRRAWVLGLENRDRVVFRGQVIVFAPLPYLAEPITIHVGEQPMVGVRDRHLEEDDAERVLSPESRRRSIALNAIGAPSRACRRPSLDFIAVRACRRVLRGTSESKRLTISSTKPHPLGQSCVAAIEL